jgi:hypothetical protein
LSLALAPCALYFEDDTEQFARKVDRAIRLSLFDFAEDVVETIARSPETPEETGALKDSVRVAPPGYAQDDSPLVVRAGSAGNFRSLNRDSTRALPATRTEALDAHRGAQLAAGASANTFTGDAFELVKPTANGYHTWVGSFLKYSFFVHEGYYNVLAGRNMPARPYIARVALPMLANDYAAYLRRTWATVRYEGA